MPDCPDGLGGDSDGPLSSRRMTAQTHDISARDEIQNAQEVRQEDAAARRGRAQGYARAGWTPPRWDASAPQAYRGRIV